MIKMSHAPITEQNANGTNKKISKEDFDLLLVTLSSLYTFVVFPLVLGVFSKSSKEYKDNSNKKLPEKKVYVKTSFWTKLRQEAVPQLILTVKRTLLFGFKALFTFLFLLFLGCWTASQLLKTFSLPTIEDEKKFLQYQLDLREHGTRSLEEAMDVLDIIDVKAQSLLSYISLSITALVFILAALQSGADFCMIFHDEVMLTRIILFFLVILSVAVIFALSVLNIVGAHTIRHLKYQKGKKSLKEYEELIVKVTLYRRIRYLVAHRISTFTAFCLGILFILMLLATLIGGPLL